MFFVTAGATDQTIDIFLQDSSSATGGGLTGLTNASSGLTCYFRKGATGTVTQLTMASQTVGGAHTDGGFVELDSTNAPGTYRLDLSDAMVSAEGTLTIYLHGATNLLQTPIRVHVASATRGYTGTALPAAAADAAGGLVISDAGGLDVDTYLGRITGNVALASSLPSNFSLLGINGSGHVSRVTLVDTTTTNTDMVAAAPTAASVADAVWDEALSGHTVAGSTGKAIKQLKEGVISVEGSVNDSSATTTTFVSNLTETTDGFYHDKVIVFISGDLAGQARHIETYTGSTKSITVSTAFTSAPADADEFLILATHEHSISEIQAGLATSASIAALNDLSSADVTAAVPTAAQIRTEIDGNSTQLALLVDGQGYQLTILAGAISNAGTATEAFTFTYNSTDYAATYAGLDTSGNRGTTVLSKP